MSDTIITSQRIPVYHWKKLRTLTGKQYSRFHSISRLHTEMRRRQRSSRITLARKRYLGRMLRRRIGRIQIPRGGRGFLRRVGFYSNKLNRVSIERKFLDIAIASTAPIPTTGEVDNAGTLLIIAQGTDENERLGLKINIVWIGIRLQVTLPAGQDDADPPDGDIVRIILYVDSQCNGVAATIGDILASTSINSFNKLSNGNRFRTLLDKNVTIRHMLAAPDGTNTCSYPPVHKSVKYFKKCNIVVQYSGTAGSLAQTRSNVIGIAYISKSGKAQITGNVRFRFTDA